eukprot:6263442-Prymnesium_polylepis.1
MLPENQPSSPVELSTGTPKSAPRKGEGVALAETPLPSTPWPNIGASSAGVTAPIAFAPPRAGGCLKPAGF